MHILRSSARGLRAGFTLIEMLAVILIITILMTFLIPKAVEAIDQAKVTGCRKNMQEIYSAFQMYEQKFQRQPHLSGVRFFAELISLKVWEDTKESSKRLNCPNAQHPSGTEGIPQDQWYTDLERLDGTWSSYAGRDCKQFPLKSMSGKEPMVADDNDGKPNHRTATVVLYGDGTAQTFELGLLEADGTLQKDEQLIVGPESQVEDLKKLSLD
ncbi:MAG: prepilin-type N-terminal cleavage/methylation domain-containing protein [Planctomycetota bacterium]